jgi:hypothetical protein
MSPGSRALLLALLCGAAIGCDGNDPDRLNRVGKKLLEKGRKVSDDAQLPRVSVTWPEDAKKPEQKTEN